VLAFAPSLPQTATTQTATKYAWLSSTIHNEKMSWTSFFSLTALRYNMYKYVHSSVSSGPIATNYVYVIQPFFFTMST
jgi:hypothetical protein